jgi:hypothetical protein
MRGQGVYADLLARRFALAHKRLGYADVPRRGLDCSRFVRPLPPRPPSPQGVLF